jgi:GNAT superfamily N-acetyltransferase
MPFRKLRRNAVDYGIATAMSKAFKAVVGVVYTRTAYRVYARTLGDGEGPIPPPPGLSFRLLDPEGLSDDMVSQIEGMEEWLWGRLRSRMANGDICLAALDGERVAAFNLVAMRGTVQIPLIRASRDLGPGEAWSEQITVHRDYRRRGLGTAVRCRLFHDLHRRGVRTLYGGTLAANHVSRSFARSLGFLEVEEIRHTRVLGASSWTTHRLPVSREQ